MRKTLLATLLGATALFAAACGGAGSTTSDDPGLESAPVMESPSDMLMESPSDMLESPSDMLESESPS